MHRPRVQAQTSRWISYFLHAKVVGIHHTSGKQQSIESVGPRTVQVNINREMLKCFAMTHQQERKSA